MSTAVASRVEVGYECEGCGSRVVTNLTDASLEGRPCAYCERCGSRGTWRRRWSGEAIISERSREPFLAPRAVHHCPGCRCDEIARIQREREEALRGKCWTVEPGSPPLSVVLL